MTATEVIGWSAVQDAAQSAVGIAFDGCHKIYVLMDEGQIALFRSYGYADSDGSGSELIHILFSTPDEVFATLENWYRHSCGLRFITAVRTTSDPIDGFRDLIPQTYDPDEEEWA